MKHILAVLLLAAPFCFNTASAATGQQTKMATCNKDATGKKGDERKAFMKECLSKKADADAAPAAAATATPAATAATATATPATATATATATAAPAQQSKMKTCNADAAGKKGDERKAFMKECLKKTPA